MPRLHAAVLAGERFHRLRTHFRVTRLAVVLRRYLNNNRKLAQLFPETDVYYDLKQTSLSAAVVLAVAESLFPDTRVDLEHRADGVLRIRLR